MKLTRPAAALGLALLPFPAIAQRTPPAQRAVVVTAGSEQALRLGDTTVSRPFGATLVDRLRVVGSYALPGERLWVVEGTGGPACPRRYVVVSRRSAENIVTSEPFGTCGTAGHPFVSRGELVIPVAAALPGGSAGRWGYRAGRLRAIDASPPPGTVASATPLAPADPAMADCRPATAVSPEEQAAALEVFLGDFGARFGTPGAVRRAELDPAGLRALVTRLACLSTWPSANREVLKRSTALFASARWGRAAFAALDTVSRDPTSDLNVIAAVRGFSAEMSYRAADHEPAWSI